MAMRLVNARISTRPDSATIWLAREPAPTSKRCEPCLVLMYGGNRPRVATRAVTLA